MLLDLWRGHITFRCHVWDGRWRFLLSAALLLQEKSFRLIPRPDLDLLPRGTSQGGGRCGPTSCLCLASSRSLLSLACLLALSSSALFLFSSSEALAMFSKRAFSFSAPMLATETEEGASAREPQGDAGAGGTVMTYRPPAAASSRRLRWGSPCLRSLLHSRGGERIITHQSVLIYIVDNLLASLIRTLSMRSACTP